MFAKQLTVFIENRAGRLSEVLGVLKDHGVNIISLSLADTTEFGLLRLIVNDAALGKEKLTEGGFSSLLSNVSIIEIPHTSGSLQKLLKTIDDNGVNIEYMYGLTIEGNSAYIVMKTNQLDEAEELFAKHGIMTASEEELAGKA